MRSPGCSGLVLLLAAACAGPRYSGPLIPELRAEQRCRVGAARSNPLVTEWPASEKANLEAQLRQGAVAVEYTGCSMRVLTTCRLPGSYAWLRTTPASDVVEIDDVDQLYAKLPLGAVSLEGELKRSGKLSITTTVSGQLRLEGMAATQVAQVPAQGDCARATHVVGAIAVGAFSMSGAGSTNGKADVSLTKLNVSAGGHSDRSAGIGRSAGDAQSCGQGTDTAPHPNCRSPIQVFLWPIPGRAAEEGPPGSVKVELLSANASNRWDVYYDDEVICSTPCSRWLDPARPLLLRAREGRGFGRGADRIFISDLEQHAASGALQVQAHGTEDGKLATGITFTSLGGTALFAGVALSSIGCGGGEHASSGLCTGGLTTLGAGAAVTAAAIFLIVDSLPRAEIRPGGPAGRSISVAVGPGVVAGSF